MEAADWSMVPKFNFLAGLLNRDSCTQTFSGVSVMSMLVWAKIVDTPSLWIECMVTAN